MKNQYYNNYINLIYLWNNNIILLANLKSLTTLAQNKLLKGKTYQLLTDILKSQLQNNINNLLNRIKLKVLSITNNLQYQSWLYQILKQGDKDIDLDYLVLKDIINSFLRLCKRPDLNSQLRNINNYQTFYALSEFILDFQNNHRQNSNIYLQAGLLFKYKNSKYTVYFINKNQYLVCHNLFGGVDLLHYFNSSWCVTKNEEYFDDYINKDEYSDEYNGYFVMILNKTNKPFALIHFGSGQIKNIHDDPLQIKDNLITDCLEHINNNIKYYYREDLLFYATIDILLKLTNYLNLYIRIAIAKNPNTPVLILLKLANDLHLNVRLAIAKNPNTPKSILLKYSNDLNICIRANVAQNPNIPVLILLKYVNDLNLYLYVIQNVAENLNTPVLILLKLSNNLSWQIKVAIAINTNTSINILLKLANDSNEYVKMYVAQNPNTPTHILLKLANDLSLNVREIAKFHLKN